MLFFLALCDNLVNGTELIIPALLFFDIINVIISIILQHSKFVFSGITFTCVQISTYQYCF